MVATPIGNLGDLSNRAITTLKNVQLIACEDTRHSGILLRELGIGVARVSLHEQNEPMRVKKLIAQLLAGDNVAIISDAGTPLISDPGYRLVKEAHQNNITVSPVPGPSALIAALSAAGLATDRFIFEGFLSAKTSARVSQLKSLRKASCTMVFYESPRRIVQTLEDCVAVFGGERQACIGRELTKRFETIKNSALAGLYEWCQSDVDQQRGEIVLLVAGASKHESESAESVEMERLIKALLGKMSVKDVAQTIAEATDRSKNELYALAIELKNSG